MKSQNTFYHTMSTGSAKTTSALVKDEAAGALKKKLRPPTPFECTVYEACKKIPLGKVVTYAVLALAIGKPKACRAVGSALKRNPFAPRIPCHRVVASDLSLGGFQGQVDMESKELKRKVELLTKEGVEMVTNEGVEEEGGKSCKKRRLKISSSSVLTTLL